MDKQTYRTQLKKVFAAFKDEPKTMLQVSAETGILRANICWFVRSLRRQNKIITTKKAPCPISKHKASFLTTDPDVVDRIDKGKSGD